MSLADALRRLRDRRGTTSIEFAMLALPFFALLIVIIETGYVFLLSFLIEGATADGARQIRTGAVQQSAAPLDQFRTLVCDGVLGLIACDQLQYEVRTFTQFTDVAPGVNNDPLNPTFVPGNSGDIVLVRVSYSWNFLTPGLNLILGNTSQAPQTVLLAASATFRNEPYDGPPAND